MKGSVRGEVSRRRTIRRSAWRVGGDRSRCRDLTRLCMWWCRLIGPYLPLASCVAVVLQVGDGEDGGFRS